MNPHNPYGIQRWPVNVRCPIYNCTYRMDFGKVIYENVLYVLPSSGCDNTSSCNTCENCLKYIYEKLKSDPQQETIGKVFYPPSSS